MNTSKAKVGKAKPKQSYIRIQPHQTRDFLKKDFLKKLVSSRVEVNAENCDQQAKDKRREKAVTSTGESQNKNVTNENNSSLAHADTTVDNLTLIQVEPASKPTPKVDKPQQQNSQIEMHRLDNRPVEPIISQNQNMDPPRSGLATENSAFSPYENYHRPTHCDVPRNGTYDFNHAVNQYNLPQYVSSSGPTGRDFQFHAHSDISPAQPYATSQANFHPRHLQDFGTQNRCLNQNPFPSYESNYPVMSPNSNWGQCWYPNQRFHQPYGPSYNNESVYIPCHCCAVPTLMRYQLPAQHQFPFHPSCTNRHVVQEPMNMQCTGIQHPHSFRNTCGYPAPQMPINHNGYSQPYYGPPGFGPNPISAPAGINTINPEHFANSYSNQYVPAIQPSRNVIQPVVPKAMYPKPRVEYPTNVAEHHGYVSGYRGTPQPRNRAEYPRPRVKNYANPKPTIEYQGPRINNSLPLPNPNVAFHQPRQGTPKEVPRPLTTETITMHYSQDETQPPKQSGTLKNSFSKPSLPTGTAFPQWTVSLEAGVVTQQYLSTTSFSGGLIAMPPSTSVSSTSTPNSFPIFDIQPFTYSDVQSSPSTSSPQNQQNGTQNAETDLVTQDANKLPGPSGAMTSILMSPVIEPPSLSGTTTLNAKSIDQLPSSQSIISDNPNIPNSDLSLNKTGESYTPKTSSGGLSHPINLTSVISASIAKALETINAEAAMANQKSTGDIETGSGESTLSPESVSYESLLDVESNGVGTNSEQTKAALPETQESNTMETEANKNDMSTTFEEAGDALHPGDCSLENINAPIFTESIEDIEQYINLPTDDQTDSVTTSINIDLNSIHDITNFSGIPDGTPETIINQNGKKISLDFLFDDDEHAIREKIAEISKMSLSNSLSTDKYEEISSYHKPLGIDVLNTAVSERINAVSSKEHHTVWGKASECTMAKNKDIVHSFATLKSSGIPIRGNGKSPDVDLSHSHIQLKVLDHHLVVKILSETKSQNNSKSLSKSTASKNLEDLMAKYNIKECVVKLPEYNPSNLKPQKRRNNFENTKKFVDKKPKLTSSALSICSYPAPDLYSRVKLKRRTSQDEKAKRSYKKKSSNTISTSTTTSNTISTSTTNKSLLRQKTPIQKPIDDNIDRCPKRKKMTITKPLHTSNTQEKNYDETVEIDSKHSPIPTVASNPNLDKKLVTLSSLSSAEGISQRLDPQKIQQAWNAFKCEAQRKKAPSVMALQNQTLTEVKAKSESPVPPLTWELLEKMPKTRLNPHPAIGRQSAVISIYNDEKNSELKKFRIPKKEPINNIDSHKISTMPAEKQQQFQRDNSSNGQDECKFLWASQSVSNHKKYLIMETIHNNNAKEFGQNNNRKKKVSANTCKEIVDKGKRLGVSDSSDFKVNEMVSSDTISTAIIDNFDQDDLDVLNLFADVSEDPLMLP